MRLTSFDDWRIMYGEFQEWRRDLQDVVPPHTTSEPMNALIRALPGLLQVLKLNVRHMISSDEIIPSQDHKLPVLTRLVL